MSQEEIFGPVAAVIRFTDDEHAIRLANGTRYSLAAGVWINTG
jgi:aldehyde dehydrogenase (NAD+)